MPDTDLDTKGQWRALVTQWHLSAPEEWAENDDERFMPERIELERSVWTGGVAYTPRQVLMWFEATRERLIRMHDISPELLEAVGFSTEADRAETRADERQFAIAGSDVRGLLDIPGSRVVTWSAYGMNSTRCSVSHADTAAALAVRRGPCVA